MKSYILLGLFAISFAPVFGQSTVFLKSYGNGGFDYGEDIKQTLDTAYIVTGSSSSFSTETADAFLMKIDSVGNFLWSYSYGGPGSEWGEKVILTKEEGFALAGYTNGSGNGGFDFYLVKTTDTGVPLWERTYGGTNWDRAYSLVQLPDSGYVMVGETYSFGAGETDVYVVRTDKDGEELWSQTYGGADHDYAMDVLLHGDSIVVVGATHSEGSGMADGLFLKYHIDDGALGATYIVGSGGEDVFNSVLHQEEYYLMGGKKSYDYYEGCDCGEDFWIFKLDTADLSIIVDTSWTGEQLGSDVANDVCVNNNNDIFYAGSTTSWGSVDISEGYTDAFLGRLLNNYTTVGGYVNNFGEQKNDVLNGVDFCYDKGVVAVGTSPFNALGSTNIIVIRNNLANDAGDYSVYDMTFDIVTLNLEEINAQESFSVYPTVFESMITITGLNNSNYEVNVYSMGGTLVHSSQENDNQIDLGHLSRGYYMMEITVDGSRYVQKMVKY